MFEGMGKMLIFFGLILVAIGVFILLGGKLGLGRLPGDIYINKGNVVFYFPIVTTILLSLILTVILNLFFRR